MGRIANRALETARHTQVIVLIVTVKGFGEPFWVGPFTRRNTEVKWAAREHGKLESL